MSTTTPDHRPQQDREPAALRRAAARCWIDPLLLLAALGLVALLVRDAARRRRHPLAMVRQAAYAGVGLVAALVIARFDYSRLREFR